DFPWTSLDIERVSVINHGSSIFGSGALNGLLNIKLREIKKDNFELVTDYGTYNTFYSGLRAAKKFEDGGISISTEKSFSDGYHKGTDYSKDAVFLTASYLKNNIYLGYDEKEYGAYDYYTPGKNMPSREYIITRYANITSEMIDGFKTSFYVRSHSDVFTLNSNNPSFYQNNHLNLIYGGLLKYNFYFETDKIFDLQYNWQREEINSSKLGCHHRIKNAALINSRIVFFGNIKTNLNLAIENYDNYKNFDMLPSLNFNYGFENVNILLNYSYTARYPNWTELYYQDPFNKGDSNLKPERSHEVGTGINYKISDVLLKGDVFYREGIDLIDWGKDSLSDPFWQIKNIAKIKTTGFNLGMDLKMFEILKLNAIYSYLDSYISEPYISKYGLAYLRSKISINSELDIYGILFIIQYVHKAYSNRNDTANIVNMTINKKINEWLDISFKIENVLNYYFEDIKGIPAPGRSVSGRVKIEF
ncbi:MAG: TonB-dependent receptor, partial [Candidatus Goldbacteria bacterium]|nr:TonB-dependent receptor [Candidatus Goldiibacteriota bacterium]